MFYRFFAMMSLLIFSSSGQALTIDDVMSQLNKHLTIEKAEKKFSSCKVGKPENDGISHCDVKADKLKTGTLFFREGKMVAYIMVASDGAHIGPAKDLSRLKVVQSNSGLLCPKDSTSVSYILETTKISACVKGELITAISVDDTASAKGK